MLSYLHVGVAVAGLLAVRLEEGSATGIAFENLRLGQILGDLIFFFVLIDIFVVVFLFFILVVYWEFLKGKKAKVTYSTF